MSMMMMVAMLGMTAMVIMMMVMVIMAMVLSVTVMRVSGNGCDARSLPYFCSKFFEALAPDGAPGGC